MCVAHGFFFLPFNSNRANKRHEPLTFQCDYKLIALNLKLHLFWTFRLGNHIHRCMYNWKCSTDLTQIIQPFGTITKLSDQVTHNHRAYQTSFGKGRLLNIASEYDGVSEYYVQYACVFVWNEIGCGQQNSIYSSRKLQNSL